MTYDLKTYVKDAIRTDTEVQAIVTDPNLLGGVMQILIAAGNMLDQIKKNVFYGKPYDINKLVAEFTLIIDGLNTIKPSLDVNNQPEEGMIPTVPRIFHSIIGISTEATELLEALSTSFETGEVDTVNILEEFGDLNWYQAIGIDEMDADFEHILKTNIKKLRSRYPERFTHEHALNRNLDKEREILEDKDTH